MQTSTKVIQGHALGDPLILNLGHTDKFDMLKSEAVPENKMRKNSQRLCGTNESTIPCQKSTFHNDNGYTTSASSNGKSNFWQRAKQIFGLLYLLLEIDSDHLPISLLVPGNPAVHNLTYIYNL